MKLLIFILILSGCTRRYGGYDLVRKVDFRAENYQRPVPPRTVLAQGEDELKSCFNQWLFFSNAQKDQEAALPMIIRSLCPSQDYLVDTEIEQTWWTTLFFSRACVKVETKCGVIKGKKTL